MYNIVHVLLAVVFGMIHNLVYGSDNLFMEINPAYFGVMLIMLALFNIVLFPPYFKTAYKFGKPLILASIVSVLFAGLFVVGAAAIPFMQCFLKSDDVFMQLVVLFIGIVLFFGLNLITINKSQSNFEKID